MMTAQFLKKNIIISTEYMTTIADVQGKRKYPISMGYPTLSDKGDYTTYKN